MDSLFILLPIALLLFGLTIWLFLWAVGDRQFDDLDKEGQRILFENDAGSKSRQGPPNSSTQKRSENNHHGENQ